jgi:hypothetical protein
MTQVSEKHIVFSRVGNHDMVLGVFNSEDEAKKEAAVHPGAWIGFERVFEVEGELKVGQPPEHIAREIGWSLR